MEHSASIRISVQQCIEFNTLVSGMNIVIPTITIISFYLSDYLLQFHIKFKEKKGLKHRNRFYLVAAIE